jgi:hypothetical protein
MEAKDWRELFTVEETEFDIKIEKKCTCGNGNCRTAKRIRCVCGCHGAAHGIETRKGMSPLETFNEPQELELEVIAA